MGRGRGFGNERRAAPGRALSAPGTLVSIDSLAAWTDRGGERPADLEPIDRRSIWGAGRSDSAHVSGRPGEAAAAFERARASMAAAPALSSTEGVDFRAIEFTDGRLAVVYDAPTSGRGVRGDQERAAWGRIFAEGQSVGHTTRALVRTKDGQLEMHHRDFALASAFSGQGFGSAYLEHCLEAYRGSGVSAVHLSAGGTVGGYFWAKTFSFEGPSTSGGQVRTEPSPEHAAAWSIWEMYGGRERLAIACEDDLAPWSLYRACDDLFAQVRNGHVHAPTPAQIAGIGRELSWEAEGRTTWPGKQILLGSEWRGVLRV